MGKFIDGEWVTDDFVNKKGKGEFNRQAVTFRDWIRADGSTPYAPAKGRYHLYVSYACPWAHRTLITRALKGLADTVDVSVVHPHMDERGWSFDEDFEGATGDRLERRDRLGEVYLSVDPEFTGRVTVPVLYDRETNRIVNNESSEIIRMFDQEMGVLAKRGPELWPEALREDLEPINDRIYDTLNNGVYKCGFAGSQSAYDKAVGELFDTLDMLESRLSERTFLVGEQLTEGDVRLFVTLIRFDAVYVNHFKCNLRRIEDYPALWSYTREIYQQPAVRKTVDLDHIKHHYFTSHESVNPRRIVPVGPAIDYDRIPDRDHAMDVPLTWPST